MKTSENDVKYGSFNMGDIDKFWELYSREGDNSSRIEGKTVPWEHTIYYHKTTVKNIRASNNFNLSMIYLKTYSYLSQI